MTINPKTFFVAPILLTAVGLSNPAQANEGEDLLKSMQSAVHALSYTGRLVFSKGNEFSEYQIEHRPGQGNRSETVVKLGQGTDTAQNANQHFSLVNSNSMRIPAKQAYSIDIGGNAQVAGQPCRVVVVRPKDKMRYLHRYCISPENGMLLRYSVMNRQQKLLEQFMFTQLSVGDSALTNPVQVPPAALSADQQELVGEAVLGETATRMQNWEFKTLPTGFKVNQTKAVPGKPEALQIVLSDGLTFVSVFIEPANNTAKTNAALPATGATNILTHKISGHTITLVGEVPQETLKAIKNGLSYVAP